MSEFSDLLVQARKDKRWSQEELGVKASISGVHVGYLERSKREPSREIVIAIARALNASTDAFLLAAGFAPESMASRHPLPSTLDAATYPPTLDERRILLEAQALGVAMSTTTEPNFWEQEPGDRRSTFLILEQAIEDVKRYRVSQGKKK